MNTMTLTAYGPWQHHHGGPGWWLAFPIGFGLLWLLVLGGAAYFLWRRTHGPSAAETALAHRYAKGEIDEDEYHERLSVLRA